MSKLYHTLICEKCNKVIGKIFYTRWVDYDGILCNDCNYYKEFKEYKLESIEEK